MLVYWSGERPNVGDELNPWLWPRILPASLTMDDSIEFFGIGSILTEQRLSRTPKSKIIFGAGKRDASPVKATLMSRCEIDFVRGPLSARALGLHDSAAITDPAALMPLHYLSAKVDPVLGRVGFVPHCSMPEKQAQIIASELGLFLILPSRGVEDFISDLQSCTTVVAEAMHAAVLADAYRIPWMGCSFSSLLSEGTTNAFKWQDWMQSLSMQSELTQIMPVFAIRMHPRIRRSMNRLLTQLYIYALKRALSEGRWMLSKDENLQRAQARLCERVNGLWDRHSGSKATMRSL